MVRRRFFLTLLAMFAIAGIPHSAAQQPAPTAQGGKTTKSGARGTGASAGKQQPDRQPSGVISGTVIDSAGDVAVGAQVQLTFSDPTQKQEMLSGENGEFSFANIPAGPFHVTVAAPGFDTKEFSGTLEAGGVFMVPEFVIGIATATTEVQVTQTLEEVAEEQIKYQEQQRVLGFIPNFYASYVPDAAPLNHKQKFELAWKSVSDPISIVGAGFLAGIYQAGEVYPGYGQGAEGYAKRFGATYGDVFIGTFVGSALLPSLLKQDPRYFYRGTGSKKSRLMYALANAVICKGDNKQYQPNYSAILGSFITSGISYTYLPASDRSVSLLMQTALIRISEGSVAGLFQEFVVRKLTPHLKKAPSP
jgi:Carboxypeptidase regulatory-like domain